MVHILSTVAVAAVSTLVLAAGTAWASELQDVLAPLEQARDKCQPVDGVHAYSMQARALYEQPEIVRVTKLEPQEKLAKSYKCSRDPATVYLYRYSDATTASEALAFAQTLIWGGRRPSIHHPEAIFTVGNVLVVVSGRKPKPVAKLLIRPGS